jgi:hypothetical protein
MRDGQRENPLPPFTCCTLDTSQKEEKLSLPSCFSTHGQGGINLPPKRFLHSQMLSQCIVSDCCYFGHNKQGHKAVWVHDDKPGNAFTIQSTPCHVSDNPDTLIAPTMKAPRRNVVCSAPREPCMRADKNCVAEPPKSSPSSC